MKTPLIPHIGIDFQTSPNVRITCFQLCTPRPGRKVDPANPMPSELLAIACVDLNQYGELERCHVAPAYYHREAAIIRLARKTQAKHKPQKFHV